MPRAFFKTVLTAATLATFSIASTGAATPLQSTTSTLPAIAQPGDLQSRLLWLAQSNADKDRKARYECYNDCLYYASGRNQYALQTSDYLSCARRCGCKSTFLGAAC